MTRPPLPPFTFDTAVQKVPAAEDGWNSRDRAQMGAGARLPTDQGAVGVDAQGLMTARHASSRCRRPRVDDES